MSGGGCGAMMGRRRWNPERSRWSVEQRLRLIQLIRQHEVIWRGGVTSAGESSADGKSAAKALRLHAFRQIQQQFSAEGITVEDCKSQWRHLRDNFVRRYKAMHGGEKPSWPYFEEMMFYGQERIAEEEEKTEMGNKLEMDNDQNDRKMEQNDAGRHDDNEDGDISQSAALANTSGWSMFKEMVLEQQQHGMMHEGPSSSSNNNNTGGGMKIELEMDGIDEHHGREWVQDDQLQLQLDHLSSFVNHNHRHAEQIGEGDHHRPGKSKVARRDQVGAVQLREQNNDVLWPIAGMAERSATLHVEMMGQNPSSITGNNNIFSTCSAQNNAPLTTCTVRRRNSVQNRRPIGNRRRAPPSTIKTTIMAGGTATILPTNELEGEGLPQIQQRQIGEGSTESTNTAAEDRFQFFGSFVEIAVRDLHQQDREIALRLVHTIYSAVSSAQMEATARAMGQVANNGNRN